MDSPDALILKVAFLCCDSLAPFLNNYINIASFNELYVCKQLTKKNKGCLPCKRKDFLQLGWESLCEKFLLQQMKKTLNHYLNATNPHYFRNMLAIGNVKKKETNINWHTFCEEEPNSIHITWRIDIKGNQPISWSKFCLLRFLLGRFSDPSESDRESKESAMISIRRTRSEKSASLNANPNSPWFALKSPIFNKKMYRSNFLKMKLIPFINHQTDHHILYSIFVR